MGWATSAHLRVAELGAWCRPYLALDLHLRKSTFRSSLRWSTGEPVLVGGVPGRGSRVKRGLHADVHDVRKDTSSGSRAIRIGGPSAPAKKRHGATSRARDLLLPSAGLEMP